MAFLYVDFWNDPLNNASSHRIEFSFICRDLHFMITDLTRHTHHSAWHTMHNVICGGARFTDEFLEILSKMRVRIKLIQGNEDQLVPLECSYSIKKRFPEVDVKIISGTDHMTVVLNRMEEFTQELEGIWSSCN